MNKIKDFFRGVYEWAQVALILGGVITAFIAGVAVYIAITVAPLLLVVWWLGGCLRSNPRQ